MQAVLTAIQPLNIPTSTPAENTWPLPWYDLQNTNYNPNAEPPEDAVDGEQIIEAESMFPPLVLNEEFIAVNGGEGGVFSREDYSRVWESTETVRASSFALSENGSQRLYVAVGSEHSHTIRGIDVDGDEATEVFETEVDRSVRSLLATDEHVYAGDSSRNSVVLDSEGEEQWEIRGSYGAITNDHIVVESGAVRRFDVDSGGIFGSDVEEGWVSSDGPVAKGYRPTIRGETVFVGSYDHTTDLEGRIYAFDLDDGELQWDPIAFGESVSTPAVTDGGCFIAGNNPSDTDEPNGCIAAVDPGDGSQIWREDVDWYPRDPVGTGSGVVLVHHEDHFDDTGYLQAYNGQTGEKLWSYEPTAPVRSVCPVGDQIDIGTTAGIELLQ